MDMDHIAYTSAAPETEGGNGQAFAAPAADEGTQGGKEQAFAEPARETETDAPMPADIRHANAARRRAAELERIRQSERERARMEMDAYIKSLHPGDPDAGDREEGPQTLPDAPSGAREEEPGHSEVFRQLAELRAFDPQAPGLDELMEGEKADAFLENAARTKNLLAAYKLTYFDELQQRQAALGRRAALLQSEEKAHLRRTSTRGSGAPVVTREMIEAYRVFDPDITAAQIRSYEARDSARVAKHR